MKAHKIFLWITYIFITVLFAANIFLFVQKVYFEPKVKSTDTTTNDDTAVTDDTDSDVVTPVEPEVVIPDSYDLAVTFVSQAPFGVWDYLHENACEEASIVLAHYYQAKIALTKEQADSDIKAMVALENQQYPQPGGKQKDLTVQEAASLARDFYGYNNPIIKYDFTWNDVKKEISSGNPVIVPTAGRALGNPNFTAPGPPYHMIVIRGYNPTQVITNDVGTHNGEKYIYSYATLDNAIHDWTGDENTIMSGRRAMLVLK